LDERRKAGYESKERKLVITWMREERQVKSRMREEKAVHELD
jgi:hypothetical protein